MKVLVDSSVLNVYGRHLPQTTPTGTARLPLELGQLKNTELPLQGRSERCATPVQQASSTSCPPMFAQPVGEGSMPGLASTATSGHLVPGHPATDVMVIFHSEGQTTLNVS